MSSITNEISSAASTFTSWDSCMSKAYCKWPVIAGIIVAGLIVLSILWCIASCLCCGATLCASCVQCLTCCGCCGACETGRRGGSRHKDDYSQMPPTPYNGYQPQPAQMMQYQQPQFAHFDAPTKAARIHEDSLPAMPSWEAAQSQRIEDHTVPAQGYGHDVEMGRLGPPGRTIRGGYSQLPPNAAPISPMSPQNRGHYNGQRSNQPYDSDLGAQRMPMNNPAYQDYSHTPLSPAPTYATNPPQNHNQHMLNPATRTTDHFASGAISPTPREYSQHTNQPQFPTPQQYNQFQQSQPFIPQSQPVSNPHYEDNDTFYNRPRSISPPILQHPAMMQQQQQYSNYDPPPSQQHYYQQEDNNGTRPPSLLQIGRKPLPGSQREV